MVGHFALPRRLDLPLPRSTRRSQGAKRAKNAGMFTSALVPANPVAVSALRFLIFTGWREQEALTLKWSDVNLDTGIATLGDLRASAHE